MCPYFFSRNLGARARWGCRINADVYILVVGITASLYLRTSNAPTITATAFFLDKPLGRLVSPS